jgi:hypothetical protein
VLDIVSHFSAPYAAGSPAQRNHYKSLCQHNRSNHMDVEAHHVLFQAHHVKLRSFCLVLLVSHVFWLPGPPQNNAREFSMVSRSASPKFRTFYTTNSMAVKQVAAYTAYNGSKDPLHHDFKLHFVTLQLCLNLHAVTSQPTIQ